MKHVVKMRLAFLSDKKINDTINFHYSIFYRDGLYETIRFSRKLIKPILKLHYL